MEKNEFDYKFKYTSIFSLNYFIQGINQSIFATVVPVYLFTLLPSVNAAAISFMLSFVLVPFILKLIYGLLSDKISLGKIGRRKPWIIGPASFSGLMWIIISIMLNLNPLSAIGIFTYGGFLVILGVAMADTAMDGFILDICPKKLLGRTTGTVWAFRSIGTIVGGPLILLTINLIDLKIIFIGLGIMTVFFSLITLNIRHVENLQGVNLISNLKLIFKKRENWKMFGFSFFMAIVDGVIFVFLALFLLIKLGLIEASGATMDILEEDINLYSPQAFISFLTGVGVFLGAFIGGYIADKKSRRIAVFSSLGLTAGSLLLLLLPIPSTVIWLLFIFAGIVGSSSGWSNSAFSAVASQYSKQYPEATSTYYSICTSFINFGTMLGLSFTGIVFNSISTITSDVLVVYGTVFITMILFSSIALIPFLLLNRNIYELKEIDLEQEKEISGDQAILKP